MKNDRMSQELSIELFCYFITISLAHFPVKSAGEWIYRKIPQNQLEKGEIYK